MTVLQMYVVAVAWVLLSLCVWSWLVLELIEVRKHSTTTRTLTRKLGAVVNQIQYELVKSYEPRAEMDSVTMRVRETILPPRPASEIHPLPLSRIERLIVGRGRPITVPEVAEALRIPKWKAQDDLYWLQSAGKIRPMTTHDSETAWSLVR